MRRVAKSVPLSVNPFEDRIVPAFTLAINGNAATANVSSVTATGTTTFTATATGATLDVADILAALNAGNNVAISTGTGGSAAGNINWTWDDIADDLTYTGAARSIAIQPDASSTTGAVTIDGVSLTFNNNLDLSIISTAPATDAVINLTGGTTINRARTIVVNSGTADLNVDSFNIAASGNIVLSTGSLTPGATFGAFVQATDTGTVTLNGPADLANGDLSLRAAGALTLTGAVEGNGSLSMYGSSIALAADIGSTTALASIIFGGGDVTFGGNDIRGGLIQVGDSVMDAAEAYLGAGTGTITGDVVVNFDGNIAPGGVATVGTLNIAGGLTFQGGDYTVDLGATSDRIALTGTGDLAIGNGSRLGDERSTGALTGVVDVQLIDFTTLDAFNPSFANFLNEGDVGFLGADVVTLSHYGPPGTGLTVAHLDDAGALTKTGTESDGTSFTAKITGGGQLVTFTDTFGQFNLLVRNTTAKSRVTIATKVNSSNDTIDFGGIRIAGPLAAFSATKANLFGDLVANGPVGSIGVGDVFGNIHLNTLATVPTTDKTSITAGSFGGAIKTPGTITTLTTRLDFNGAITAAAIGTVKVGRTLSGFTGPWNVTGAVTKITAAEVTGLNLTARNLGSLSTLGSTIYQIAGNLDSSTITLKGNAGGRTLVGLGVLSVKANVLGSTIDVEEGNVSSVSVGRFINSRLFLDYSPVGAFNTTGVFDSAARFKLTSFATKATPLNQPGALLDWAFAGSQIVADTIGIVRLSGLNTDNLGDSFGIKFRTAGGSVRVTKADAGLPTNLLNVNLTPGANAIAGDLFFVAIP